MLCLSNLKTNTHAESRMKVFRLGVSVLWIYTLHLIGQWAWSFTGIMQDYLPTLIATSYCLTPAFCNDREKLPWMKFALIIIDRVGLLIVYGIR